MRLDRLLDEVEVLDLRGDPATEITDATHDSASVAPGALFCCVPGSRADGHDFAPDAAGRGAAALLCERPVAVDLPQVLVRDVRVAMAPAAAAVWGHPSRALEVVGVTGTNGKTTTTLLLRHIFETAGRRAEVIGTMTGARTTPEATDLQRRLASFLSDGVTTVAMEVSSVGLAQHRVDAMRFAVGVFTNLTPDELAVHGSVEAYFEAKARLFEPDLCALGVVNDEDPYGRRLVERARIPVRTFSLADAVDLDLRAGGATFGWRGHAVDLHLDGAYNVANALAAATAAVELGVDPAAAAAALSSFEPVAGHAHAVEEGQPFRVLVDFAHTAGAIAAVCGAARASAPEGSRVILVFGGGGDRDRSRRPLMGAAAAEAADVVVVTSDNPRTEDPLKIIEEVAGGAAGAPRLLVEPDRRAAIALALAEARAGDVVIVAGKGHETGQIIGTEVVPFDDAEVVRELLQVMERAS